MFACSICGAGFQSHKAMVEHVKRFHKFDSSFKTTGIFIGKSRVKTRGSKTPLGHVYEKCHVPLTPGLTHVNQVLTPQFKKKSPFLTKRGCCEHYFKLPFRSERSVGQTRIRQSCETCAI